MCMLKFALDERTFEHTGHWLPDSGMTTDASPESRHQGPKLQSFLKVKAQGLHYENINMQCRETYKLVKNENFQCEKK